MSVNTDNKVEYRAQQYHQWRRDGFIALIGAVVIEILVILAGKMGALTFAGVALFSFLSVQVGAYGIGSLIIAQRYLPKENK